MVNGRMKTILRLEAIRADRAVIEDPTHDAICPFNTRDHRLIDWHEQNANIDTTSRFKTHVLHLPTTGYIHYTWAPSLTLLPNFTKNHPIAVTDINTRQTNCLVIKHAVAPTAGILNSYLCHSLWVSWWKNRNLGRFFLRLLMFSTTISFILQFLHPHFIY